MQTWTDAYVLRRTDDYWAYHCHRHHHRHRGWWNALKFDPTNKMRTRNENKNKIVYAHREWNGFFFRMLLCSRQHRSTKPQWVGISAARRSLAHTAHTIDYSLDDGDEFDSIDFQCTYSVATRSNYFLIIIGSGIGPPKNSFSPPFSAHFCFSRLSFPFETHCTRKRIYSFLSLTVEWIIPFEIRI